MAAARRAELERLAPTALRYVWRRDGSRILLCGTLGAAFDRWQRALASVSAADGYFAQQIGLDRVEAAMDAAEAEARASLAPGERLLPRRSPGYGAMPLDLSRDILVALDAPRRIGVTCTDSGLLAPAKSVTAVCEIVLDVRENENSP